MSIDTVGKREKLAPRREPYWRKMGTGQHLGYRRTEDGGSWIARAYDSGTRARAYNALGDLAGVTPGDQFTRATDLARDWFDHLGKGGSAEVLTVRQACARYAASKPTAAAKVIEGRFARHVYDDPIAGIALPKLTRTHVKEWRRRLAALPATQPKRGPNCRTKTAPAPESQRAPATINRDMVPFRAALNMALREGFVTSDAAWSRALAPIDGVKSKRTLYLSRDERRALLAALQPDLRAFVHALCTLPLRPGALAALSVRDFDSRAGVLTVPDDKAGAGRKLMIPDSASALLKAQTKGKTPAAPLFARADGGRWQKDGWKGPIKTAARLAELPDETVAYTLRHSAITDLVTAGLPLLTIAQLAGTSARMIEATYGHLQQDKARDALAGLAL